MMSIAIVHCMPPQQQEHHLSRMDNDLHVLFETLLQSLVFLADEGPLLIDIKLLQNCRLQMNDLNTQWSAPARAI